MATTWKKLRSLVSVGALVLITACGSAAATPDGPDDGAAEDPEVDSSGGSYLPDCRTRATEMLPC
jgi:hypothetical protein